MVNYMVVDNDTIENRYYINHLQNENNYIVINTESEDKYIDYLLLNIDIYDYLKVEYIDNYLNDLDNLTKFDKAYLNNFGVNYINEFLYVEYNEDDIYDFLDQYEKYFIDDLRTDLIKLYNNLMDEIKTLEDLDLLY